MRMIIDRTNFEVELHEEAAPKTCKALLRLLPFQGEVLHARWCGEAIFIPIDEMPLLELENQTVYPSKGELIYYPGMESIKEILIAYGACHMWSRIGPLPSNHFATIKEVDRLAQIGRRIHREGVKRVTLKL